MKNKKRVVIKIGTAVLSQKKAGSAQDAIEALVEEVIDARKKNWDCILVSSGAIGQGVQKLGLKKRPNKMPEKQAAAAVGQVFLMKRYQDLFAMRNVLVAQILLTRSDLDDHARYLNIKNTIKVLLKQNIVPIINENDTVATEEIKFGDNDQLSALVSAKMDAQVLILLSNVEGLLKTDEQGQNQVVPLVPQITTEIEKLAWQGIKSSEGTGGMSSKIEAAKIASGSGATMVIASALRENIITDILEQKNVGTWFLPQKTLQAKQKWLRYAALPKGKIIVPKSFKLQQADLQRNNILRAEGFFKAGEVVLIESDDNKILARGVCEASWLQIQESKDGVLVRKNNLALMPSI